MKRLMRSLAIFAVTIPSLPLHAADPVFMECPTTITPPSEGLTAPTEWVPYWENGTAEQLEGAEIRSGKSFDKNLSVLVRPHIHLRNTHAMDYFKHEVDAFWNFQAFSRSQQTFWIICRYSSTSLELYRRLPTSVHSCRMIAQDTNVGNPSSPMTIRCR